MERKRVMFTVPRFSVSPPECEAYRAGITYMLGRWESMADCPYEFEFGLVPDMMVQLAREIAAKEAIARNCDYLFMIDDDMLGPDKEPADFVVRSLLADDVDIVAPLAFMRNPPHYPVCYARRGGWNPETQMESFRYDNILNYPKDQLFECDGVGFGAVLIKTSALKAVGDRHWFMSTNPTGEDILFCEKARKKGLRVFMDTRVKLKHLGPRQYIDEAWYERHDPKVQAIRDVTGDWSRAKAEQNLAS